MSVTQTELEELATIGDNTISADQWAGLGGATTAGIALWDDADAPAQLVTLGAAPAAGSANIVTVGALASGSLAAGFTDVPVAQGGTGVSTLALNGVLYGTGATAVGVTAIGTAGQVLVAGADPFVPVFSSTLTGITSITGLTTPLTAAQGGTGLAALRENSVLDIVASDETPVAITAANILTNKFITNQGSSSEADWTLPDIEYYASVTFIVNEAFIEEICPVNADAHEAFDLNGTVLDASDCIDSPILIGSKMVATRMQIADGTWKWSFDTVRGAWVDTGATD